MSKFRANCVFCDQVREETSGKLILIGVISGGLLMERPKDERVMSLTQFIQIRGLDPGEYDFTLTIEKHHAELGTISAGLRGHFAMGPDELEASIVAEGLKVHVAEECVIKAILQLNDEEPMEVGAFVIEFHPQEDEVVNASVDETET